MSSSFTDRVERAVWARMPRPLRRAFTPPWLYLLSRKLTPIGELVIERGTPVDRVFIERFLERHASDIRGRVLEVQDAEYTRRFGGARVSRSDVLDVIENPRANVRADIRTLAPVADDSYDCLVITQVLQYVDDLDAAVRTIRRVLAPGGTALVTVPTMGKLDGQQDDVSGHYWRLTADSARLVFGRHFADDELEIEAWGNVLVGLAFWVGLAKEDLPARALEHFDPHYACGVTIRATKRVPAPPAT
jgi:SAM-dependent methyltransferase